MVSEVTIAIIVLASVGLAFFAYIVWPRFNVRVGGFTPLPVYKSQDLWITTKAKGYVIEQRKLFAYRDNSGVRIEGFNKYKNQIIDYYSDQYITLPADGTETLHIGLDVLALINAKYDELNNKFSVLHKKYEDLRGEHLLLGRTSFEQLDKLVSASERLARAGKPAQQKSGGFGR